MCELLRLHVPICTMMMMPAAAVLRYEELCRIFLGEQVEEVLRFPLELTTYQVGCSAGSPASACMVQQPAGCPALAVMAQQAALALMGHLQATLHSLVQSAPCHGNTGAQLVRSGHGPILLCLAPATLGWAPPE